MEQPILLTLNAGSSSLKFAVYKQSDTTQPLVRGQVERLGGEALLRVRPADGARTQKVLGEVDHQAAVLAIFDALQAEMGATEVVGVGHRIVHGGVDFVQPTLLLPETIDALRLLEPLAPLHQPHNLAGVQAAIKAFPGALQLGCFDTAFHQSQDWVQQAFALPRAYYDKGVRRYGFHGLSYSSLMASLRQLVPARAEGRVVFAHLGNGASMCATHRGQSVTTTMGFSALDGLAMGTRCGALDPGVLLYLLEQEQMDVAQLTTLLYKESGMKGLSGGFHDMRELMGADTLASRQAVDYYVARIRRELGALVAVLGGLDTLVFSGGVGENQAAIRARVCEDMAWLGIALDPAHNQTHQTQISRGETLVMVIPTDEEGVIAQALQQALLAA